jgi:hypothetical protein
MKILFFAPHSEIWVQSFPEALVAEALQKRGHIVEYATCGRLLDEFCIPMAVHGLTPAASPNEKERICDACQRSATLLRRNLKLQGPDLSEMITPAEKDEIARSLDKLDQKSVLDFQYQGVPVGRISLFNTVIRYKTLDFQFTDEQWRGYLADVKTALYALKAGEKILDLHHPDRILTYNSLYAAHGVICRLAENRGIPAFFMHAGQNLSNRLKTLMMGRGNPFSFAYHLLSEWPKYESIPCKREHLALVTDHILQLLKAKSGFVYSAPISQSYFDIRERFGISATQKIVVAVLSSYDEAFASHAAGAMRWSSEAAFETQADWIAAIIEHASKRPDLFFIIRVHPRELENRRDKRRSQHDERLGRALERLPPNVVANWPKDGISVYDLVRDADVFLNAWSSVGREVAFLGVPVVSHLRGIALFPDNLQTVETDPMRYFAAVDDAISRGWSFEVARMAYRWGCFEFHRTLFFIDDSYTHDESAHRSLMRRLVDRILRTIDANFQKRIDCRRRATNLSASEQLSKLVEAGAASLLEIEGGPFEKSVPIEQETESLRAELRRVASAMLPSIEAQCKSRLFQNLAGERRDDLRH